MKLLYLTVGMLMLSLFSSAQTDSITVSGTIAGLANQKVNISFADNAGKNQYKSVAGVDNKFSVRLPVQNAPAPARLTVALPENSAANSMMIPPLNFFIWNKNLQIKGNAALVNVAVVQGDAENDLYNVLIQQGAKSEIRYRELLSTAFDKNIKRTPEDSTKLHQELKKLSLSGYFREKEFVKNNPKSFASVFLLNRLGSFYTADDYLKAWNTLAPTYKNTAEAESIKKTLEKLAPTMAGIPVFAFERIDKNGNKVSPELLKGRTYLLDFWGSWCGPCRASHPHLKSLYSKYKDQGFEIVAIAQERGKTLDDCKATWLKAIQEDQINWVHLLNQDGIAQQNLVSTFHVNAFPTKILIGADGKIILRISASATDDIDQALERIYGF
ncbi:TlpA disulfide reductase family protein [Pedobacter sp. MC2016-24]|uniref:TlpA disulfide reductase family protein n=1 Tax=Pedobacter sp. MC2016-24 TaxID=2780090 RepID=UPI00187FF57A|nr:TlpA disulfide reductase family protein [Pedobacter sp. MC2016-24]MBE9598994.1 redoxin family protein [Pedobacter sp. MC2016-24]